MKKEGWLKQNTFLPFANFSSRIQSPPPQKKVHYLNIVEKENLVRCFHVHVMPNFLLFFSLFATAYIIKLWFFSLSLSLCLLNKVTFPAKASVCVCVCVTPYLIFVFSSSLHWAWIFFEQFIFLCPSKDLRRIKIYNNQIVVILYPEFPSQRHPLGTLCFHN